VALSWQSPRPNISVHETIFIFALNKLCYFLLDHYVNSGTLLKLMLGIWSFPKSIS
jgi:hypothetical protein